MHLFFSIKFREDHTGAVGTLSCTDTDTGVNGQLQYTITSVDSIPGAGNFAIDVNTGAVSLLMHEFSFGPILS